MGLIDEGHLASAYSLAEVRVLYELDQREDQTAAEVGAELRMDAGYLSRILRRLGDGGLVGRRASTADRRRTLLRLTARGKKVFADLDRRAAGDVAAVLGSLAPAQRGRLRDAMRSIEALLGGERPARSFVVREHRPGDMGWVVHRHAVLYAAEHGWVEMEALVAHIVARFLDRFDPARERCWIAEEDGENIGSVFLVSRSRTVAKLRLLRGLGVGQRLVDECIRFARQVGYRTMTLWTTKGLDTARHIYESRGFRLTAEAPHVEFGRNNIGQTFELPLR
jgi:DNA-binding MarR family transcriptional regulator/N-acetylglutamate synthase-like GNAT family acetyltransferase